MTDQSRTVAEVARSLTDARKVMVLALPSNGGWGRAPDRRVAVRAWWADRRLVDHKHFPEDANEWALTPLGLAVRAHLEQSS